jgi:hypothetical protein
MLRGGDAGAVDIGEAPVCSAISAAATGADAFALHNREAIRPPDRQFGSFDGRRGALRPNLATKRRIRDFRDDLIACSIASTTGEPTPAIGGNTQERRADEDP